MKKKDKKLVLNKETIALLERDQLGIVAGGWWSDTNSCYCPIIV